MTHQLACRSNARHVNRIRNLMQRGANAKSSFSAETTQTATQPNRFSIMLLIGWGRSLGTPMRPTSKYQFGARHCLPVCAYLRARSRFREFFQNIMQNTGKNSTTPPQPPECVVTARSTRTTGNATSSWNGVITFAVGTQNHSTTTDSVNAYNSRLKTR